MVAKPTMQQEGHHRPEVTFPDPERIGSRRGWKRYPHVLGTAEVRGCGVKRPDRPRAFTGDDTAKDCGIRLCRDGEGKDGDPDL